MPEMPLSQPDQETYEPIMLLHWHQSTDEIHNRFNHSDVGADGFLISMEEEDNASAQDYQERWGHSNIRH